MGPPEVTAMRSRIRWVVVTEVKAPEHSAVWLEPPELVIGTEQMGVDKDPSDAVTAKSTSMVVEMAPEKSNEADHNPDGIDSSATGSSEKKQIVVGVVSTAVWPRLPWVVFMPLASGQPGAVIRVPPSCRKSLEPAKSMG